MRDVGVGGRMMIIGY